MGDGFTWLRDGAVDFLVFDWELDWGFDEEEAVGGGLAMARDRAARPASTMYVPALRQKSGGEGIDLFKICVLANQSGYESS